MIKMSDDFNNSVMSTEREMKGYVEVTYKVDADKTEYSVDRLDSIEELNIPLGSALDWTNTKLILDNDRKGKQYATLEPNLFRLDGTFVLPNNQIDKNPGIGYISNSTYEEAEYDFKNYGYNITAEYSGKPIKAITLYFQENPPLDISIDLTYWGDDDEQYTKTVKPDSSYSGKLVQSVMFDEIKPILITLYINDVLYPDHRVRLQEIDFGLSAIYEDDELISFKTIEEIDIFNDSMPGNEIEVKVGDFENKFDYNNKNGITQYLNDSVLIKPFVGVITSEAGVEYCPKGTYWLDSYDSNGKEATLKGKDIFGKLQDKDFNKYYAVEEDRIMKTNATISDWLQFKSEKWGVNIIDEHLLEWEISKYGYPNKAYINEVYSLIGTKLDNLQRAGIQVGGTFNGDRYGNIVYKSLYSQNDTNSTLKWFSFDNMKDYPKIETKTPIKTFNIHETTIHFDSIEEWETFYSNTFNSNDIIELYIDAGEYKTMKFPEVTNGTILDSTWSVDPTMPDGEKGHYAIVYESYAYIKLQCNGNVTITIKGFNNKKSETDNIREVGTSGSDISISDDYISSNGTYDLRLETDNIIDFNLQNRKKHSASFQFNGDPSLECGDVIYIENKYDKENFDEVIITKIESEFKGSYSESIEGDINEFQNGNRLSNTRRFKSGRTKD